MSGRGRVAVEAGAELLTSPEDSGANRKTVGGLAGRCNRSFESVITPAVRAAVSSVRRIA